MDVTPAFNELLRRHGAPETRKTFSQEIDAFLKEAYRIVR
jgi:hypothetical protein